MRPLKRPPAAAQAQHRLIAMLAYCAVKKDLSCHRAPTLPLLLRRLRSRDVRHLPVAKNGGIFEGPLDRVLLNSLDQIVHLHVPMPAAYAGELHWIRH